MADAMADKCPRCGSPSPHLHPAVQFEGEVAPCSDGFHFQLTSQNTQDKIDDLRNWFRDNPNG